MQCKQDYSDSTSRDYDIDHSERAQRQCMHLSVHRARVLRGGPSVCIKSVQEFSDGLCEQSTVRFIHLRMAFMVRVRQRLCSGPVLSG
jgi:hypothetical protein